MLHNMLRAASGNRAGIPTDGLVAWYTMDNISGSTLVDEMGNYDGTITGATQVAGAVDQALNFDGADDYVSAPSITENATTTLCFWMNFDVAKIAILIEKFQSGYWSVQLLDNGAIGLYKLGTGGNIQTSALSANTWHHVIVEINSGANGNIYINNVLNNASVNAEITPLTGSTASFIIASRSGTAGFFDGTIDDLFFYNRALTSDERQTIYGRGA